MNLVLTPKQYETLKIALSLAMAEARKLEDVELYRSIDDIVLEIYEQED